MIWAEERDNHDAAATVHVLFIEVPRVGTLLQFLGFYFGESLQILVPEPAGHQQL